MTHHGVHHVHLWDGFEQLLLPLRRFRRPHQQLQGLTSRLALLDRAGRELDLELVVLKRLKHQGRKSSRVSKETESDTLPLPLLHTAGLPP